MRKIMNEAEKFVDESLEGIVLAHGDMLRFAEGDHRAVVRSQAPTQGKVAIVTGGGYGHLPVFLGYVGEGLCDGVAVGNVFTSPSCDAIVEAAKAVNGGAGVLFLFGNYMGDSMNFEMASEVLEMEGIPNAIVKVSDDIASAAREQYSERRGVAGIFFAYKIAGALAARGESLKQICSAMEKVCGDISTLGVAMSSCQLPGAQKPIFEIAEHEMELGMGIHGEPGVERMEMRTSRSLAEIIVSRLILDQSLSRGDEVAVLLNSLGATSKEELYVLYRDVYSCLEQAGIRIVKNYIGEYATSLEMMGISISLLKVQEGYVSLLEYPVYTPFVRV